MRLCKILLVIIISFVMEGYCQEDSKDQNRYQASRESLYKNQKKFLALFDAALPYYSRREFEKGILLLDSALKYWEYDSLKYVHTIHRRAIFKMESFITDSAIEDLLKVEKIARRNGFQLELGRACNVLGITYVYTGRYREAGKYLYEALELFEKLKEPDLSTTLINIGLYYYKLKDNNKAIHYYEKALNYRIQNEGGKNTGRIFINLGLCYNGLNKIDIALDYFRKFHKTCDANCDEDLLMQYRYAMGVVYDKMNKFDASEYYFDSSLELSRKRKDYRFIAENLVSLSVVFYKTDRLQKSKETLHQAEMIVRSNNLDEIALFLYKQAIMLYTELGDKKNLSFYQQKYYEQKGKVHGFNLIKHLSIIEAGYLEEQYQAIILSQDKQLALQNLISTKYKFLIIGVFSILFLLIVLIFIQYQKFKNKRSVYRRLKKKVIERTSAKNDFNKVLYNEEEELKKELQNLQRMLNDYSVQINGIGHFFKNQLPYFDLKKVNNEVASSLQEIDRKIESL